MGTARPARRGLSPLDEELELLPGELSPALAQELVELGATLPFGKAAAKLHRFTGVWVSEAGARAYTEGAGAAYVAEQATELARLARELPPDPPGPAVQQVSVDGAMVPLVGGAWAEVKTLAIGTVARRPDREGLPAAHAVDVSYFSRMLDVASFIRQAQLPLHRRGAARAGTVVAVHDGSEWISGFVAALVPRAVRILDFPHAHPPAGTRHLTLAGQAAFGAGTPALGAWLRAQAHALKHEALGPVLAALGALPVAAARDPEAAAAARDASVAYLAKRRVQVDYPRFRALGYPIGSGMVESANKLMVEARLKGSGMHWAPGHVDPMLALRTIECADGWDAAWPRIADRLRRQARDRRTAQRHARRPQPPAPPVGTPTPTASPPTVPARRHGRPAQIHRAPRQHPPP